MIRRFGLRCFLVLALVSLGSGFGGLPLEACDDTILALIRGDRPEDGFSQKLLDMGGRLREAAGDIKAFNHLAARNRVKGILKDWVRFDNQFVMNPPAGATSGEEWKGALASISLALGELDELIAQEKYQDVHDLIEPVVLRMSILGTLSGKTAPARRFLESELALYQMKPGFRGKSGPDLLEDIRGFRAGLADLITLFPPGTASSQANLQTALDEYSREAEASAATRTPGALSRYNTLLEKFDGLKQTLLKTGWFKVR